VEQGRGGSRKRGCNKGSRTAGDFGGDQKGRRAKGGRRGRGHSFNTNPSSDGKVQVKQRLQAFREGEQASETEKKSRGNDAGGKRTRLATESARSSQSSFLDQGKRTLGVGERTLPREGYKPSGSLTPGCRRRKKDPEVVEADGLIRAYFSVRYI